MTGDAGPGTRAAVALGITALGIAAAILLLGDAAYIWVKAAHVIAIISWMAGMLYLPRLFIYHCDAAPGSELSETLKVMERRLLRIIINPAMGLAWILGLLARLARRVSDGRDGSTPSSRSSSRCRDCTASCRPPSGAFAADQNTTSARHLAHHQRGAGRPDGRALSSW